MRQKKTVLWQQSLSLAAIAVLVVGSFFFYFHERVNIPGFPIGQAYTGLEVPQDVVAGKRSETHFIIPLKYDRSSSFAGWNFVSIPFTSSLPVGQALTTNTPAEFFHYDPTQGKYLTRDTIPLTAGTGYWVKVNQEGQLTIPLTPSSRQFYLSLKKGWNQIGLPTVNTLKTTDVKIKESSTTTTYTLAEAYAHVIVGDFLFTFDSAQGKWIQISTDSTTAILSPGVGYFLYMYKDAELFVELPDLVVEKASLDKGTAKTIELSTTQSEVTGSAVHVQSESSLENQQLFSQEQRIIQYSTEEGIQVIKEGFGEKHARGFFDPTVPNVLVADEFAPGYIVEFKSPSQIAGAAVPIGQATQILQSVHDRAKRDILGLVQKELHAQKLTAVGQGTAAFEVPSEEKVVTNEYDTVFNGMAVNVDAEVAKKIEKLDYVEKVWPNRIVHALLMDTVPLIKANEAWRMNAPGKTCSGTPETCLTGKGVKVAVIDTGVDYTHPDFGSCTKDQFVAGSCAKVISGFDFVNKDNDPMDDQGHGTHVAGTIAGNGALKGIAPDASIIAYKVLDSGGSGYTSNIIAAIDRATDPNGDGNSVDHVEIMSLSLGGDGGDPDDPLSIAIDTAVSKGVVAVIAAGNSGPRAQTIGSPGTARRAITVGATYKKEYDSKIGSDINPHVDQVTYFSSRGPVVWDNKVMNKPDIVAPGALICAARYDSIYPEGQHPLYKPCLDDKHVQMMGTSMATPVVSGVVALLKQKHPDWTPGQVKTALKNTAKDLTLASDVQGLGRVNVQRGASLETAPPVAAIYEVEKSKSLITIRGSAAGNTFKEYAVYYKKDAKENLICKSTTSITQGALCSNFGTSQLEDGQYDLILRVTDTQDVVWQDRAVMGVSNLQIIYPPEGALSSLYDQIEIRGDIYGTFDTYSVEYGEGKEPVQWNIISRSESGADIHGILSKWDPSNLLRDGIYTIKVSVKRAAVTSVGYRRIVFDKTLHKGWPVQMKDVDSLIPWDAYTPTLADIDGDGKKEIIIEGPKELHLFSEGGTERWSSSLGSTYRLSLFGQRVNPIIADIDKDSKKEVVTIRKTKIPPVVSSLYKCFHAITSEGKSLLSWPRDCPFTQKEGEGGATTSDPSIFYDLDGDGVPELIAPFTTPMTDGFDGYKTGIAVYTSDMKPFSGWPKIIESNVVSNINTRYVDLSGNLAVVDINGDGTPEIIAIVTFSRPPNTYRSFIYIWDSHGHPFIDPVDTQALVHPNSLVVADLDGNKDLEIGFTTLASGRIVFYHPDGKLLDGWPIHPTGLRYPEFLTIGDLDKDGKPEVIVTVYDSDTKNKMVYVYTNQGKISSGWPQSIPSYGSILVEGFVDPPLSYPKNVIYAQPTIGDINGDGYPDVIVMSGGGRLYAWDKSGVLLSGFPKDINAPSYSGVALGDLDNDGKVELVAATAKGRVYVWNTGSTYDESTMEWPMFRHDAQHTGVYIPKKKVSCSDITQNNDETDIDCGGSCPKCAIDKKCNVDGDCQSNKCDSVTKKCVAPLSSITITSPAEGATVTTAVVLVAFTPTNIPSDKKIKAYVDSNAQTPLLDPTATSYNTLSLVNGAHTVKFEVVNADGSSLSPSIITPLRSFAVSVGSQPCSARPDCVIEGQEFAISATISNKGKGTLLDVSSVTLSILNEKGIEIKGMATQTGSLKPDQSTVLAFSALKLSPGKYTAVIKANPSPSLDETNPNNNMYSFTLEVQPKVSSQCTDTDADTQFPDGRNYAKKGKAFLPPPLPTLQTASLADKEDFCKDTSTLVEFYCKGNEIAQEEHACSCADGRCG